MPIPLNDIRNAMASAKRMDKRMAGDAAPEGLDKLIKSIRTEAAEVAEDAAVQDAMEYMHRRNIIDSQFGQAGLSPAQSRMTESLGSLMGGRVPQAFITKSPGVERRVHTTYETNPVTDSQDIVVFDDPGTGRPLVTNLGKDVDMQGFDKATEYVQDHVMRLMGQEPQLMNATGNYNIPDFKIGNTTIDGEIRFDTERGNIPVQLYTKVQPKNMRGMDQYGVRDAVDALITDKVRKGNNVFDAISALEREGSIRRPLVGKLLKEKPGERVDQLMMTTLAKDDALRNQRTRDRIAIAPKAARMVDLDAVNDYIVNAPQAEVLRRLQSRANRGNSQSGDPRARIYMRVPETAPGVSFDVVSRFPHAAQLVG